MLDDLVRKLPTGLFASIVIGLGIILILVLNPMHTACVSQNEIMVEDLTPMFFTKPNPKFDDRKPPSLYSKSKDLCLRGSTQGSCLSWFRSLEKLDKELVKAPSECVSAAVSLKEIKDVLAEAPEMMIRLAWGATAPKSYFDRNGWFDSYHLSTFCNLKEWSVDINGKEAWKEFQEDLMEELPGSENLKREEVWRRSLLSTDCNKY